MLSIASVAQAQGNFDSPERVDTTLALDRNGTVSISIYSGRVNVTGASGSSVRIRGTVERDEMQIRSRSGMISVSLEPERGRGGRAEFDVTVPIGTNVVLEAHSAPLTVRGVKGPAQLETLSGDVQISDAVGTVEVEAVSGSIDISKVDGNVRAEAVSGTVTVTDATGDIDAESVSGRVSISGARSRSVRAETVSGSIGYSGTIESAGNYSFTSHSGRLNLGLPPNAGATVSLQTFSGSVDSDFPVTLERQQSRHGHESRMEFRIGDGRSRIVLETFSGAIRILRGTTRENEE
jgi:DUF4097 and DUF4098 domain-containing protein YvlB